HGSGSGAGCAGNGVELRSADAGNVLRHADAGGKPATRRSRKPGRWVTPRLDVPRRDGGFYKVISPSYFSTLGIKPVKGRLLADTDTSNSPPVLVMNERMVKRFFPHQDPVG